MAVGVLAAMLLSVLAAAPAAAADLGQPSGGNPQQGSIGVKGKKAGPPPSRPATIVTPANGQNVTSIPVTVSGFCPGDVLVKIYDNKIFVGAAKCKHNSYSLKADLFSGKNKLVARVFDNLGQEGPKSNTVTVHFTDVLFQKFGSRVLLTSDYAKRGTKPGQKLTWPLILSGGVGPYALSADWGDGSAPDLKSQPFTGIVKMSHTYAHAGVYTVIFKATGKNGTKAFLQVVAVVKGKPAKNAGGSSKPNHNGPTQIITRVALIPLLILLILCLISFYLGRRYELLALRRKIERDSQA